MMMKKFLTACVLLAMLCACVATALAAQEYCIPDPRIYFGVEAYESGVKTDEQWMTIKFESEEACNRAFREYADLLMEDRFGFYVVTDDEDRLLLDCFGSIRKIEDLKSKGNYVVKLNNFGEYGAAIQINVSLDVALEDTGDRPETAYNTVAPKNSGSSGSSGSSSDQDCSWCGGSGNCRNCGGSGRVYNWLPGTREYVNQNCRDCSGTGDCSWCRGSGKQ